MGFIPDCRKDENYNYQNLKEADKAYIDGYDKAVELLESAFDFSLESDSLLEYFGSIKLPESLKQEDCETVKDLLFLFITNHMEMSRDEIITSMIDNYEE